MQVSSLPRPIRTGDFILVRSDHADTTRAGRDGLVIAVDVDSVALIFGFDRNNRDQRCICVGQEAWGFDELDLSSIEH